MGKVYKMLAIGDGSIGKTCLLTAFTDKKPFSDNYVPTVFDNKFVTIETKSGEKLQAELWDTAGQEAFDRIRNLSYRDSDLFLICFSVVNQTSLDNIMAKWVPEIETHDSAKSAVRILVGTKGDLRGSQKTISMENIQLMQKKIGAVDYIETSAKAATNINECFDLAAMQFLRMSSSNSGSGGGCCIIL